MQMYSHQMWQNQNKPGYTHKPSYSLVFERSRVAKYWEPIKEEPKTYKIQKDKENPDMGTYKWEASYDVLHKNKRFYMAKGPRKNFIHDALKEKAIVPAPNLYKDQEKGYKMLSPPPISMRRMR